MKNLIFAFLFISIQSFGQKTITFEEMKTITKGAFENITCDIYVGKDGYSYKIGDTLNIGRPSNNKTFSFISEFSTILALNGQMPQPLGVNLSGTNTIIKKMSVAGNKRMGFKMGFQGKGICGMCPSYTIDFEQAIATGEIKSKGFTKESAIAKLKEGKELLDLGLMKQVDYDKLKESLVKYILDK
jgi:hypothetical protein